VFCTYASGSLIAQSFSMGRNAGDPVPALTATPTRAVHPVAGARLGGTEEAFAKAFGAPTVWQGFHYYYTTLKPLGIPITIVIPASSPTGMDGHRRVGTLTVGLSPLGAWSATLAAQLYTPYLPPDAQHVLDFSDPHVGLTHVYRSADLAVTFPAADFRDGNGNTLPPGTLAVSCDDPAQPYTCTMTLGG
jgi:hypothetical protein